MASPIRVSISLLLLLTFCCCSVFKPSASPGSFVHSVHQFKLGGNVCIVGRVTDVQDGESLPGANVLVLGTNKGAATDIDGNYSIGDVQPGKCIVKVSYLGYEPCSAAELNVKANSIVVLDFRLKASKVESLEVN